MKNNYNQLVGCNISADDRAGDLTPRRGEKMNCASYRNSLAIKSSELLTNNHMMIKSTKIRAYRSKSVFKAAEQNAYAGLIKDIKITT
ncbi:hypothetical protein [Sodalis-like endosymbiont of Proechinophthirus fluctus]|uniref:hypothetical protein n=1 Tax=Sodalis-like endosymbiont of Proechinophthirus fluctus TaxID=1462730 RepID=UPI000B165698|nr:hypothetical protein [Sodalis-like endosymbiont of Proechinophthirus fluctus]